MVKDRAVCPRCGKEILVDPDEWEYDPQCPQCGQLLRNSCEAGKE